MRIYLYFICTLFIAHRKNEKISEYVAHAHHKRVTTKLKRKTILNGSKIFHSENSTLQPTETNE